MGVEKPMLQIRLVKNQDIEDFEFVTSEISRFEVRALLHYIKEELVPALEGNISDLEDSEELDE